MGSKRSPEMHQRNLEIVRLRTQKGMNLQQIANMYKISRQRVEQVLYEYGAVLHREDTLKMCAEQVYNYIIEYKIENDGNSPFVKNIVNDGKVFWYGRARKALDYLEERGKIKIDRSIKPNMIFVTGGQWLPPEENM